MKLAKGLLDMWGRGTGEKLTDELDIHREPLRKPLVLG